MPASPVSYTDTCWNEVLLTSVHPSKTCCLHCSVRTLVNSSWPKRYLDTQENFYTALSILQHCLILHLVQLNQLLPKAFRKCLLLNKDKREFVWKLHRKEMPHLDKLLMPIFPSCLSQILQKLTLLQVTVSSAYTHVYQIGASLT